MLYVVNKSTLVSNADVETMTRACALQLQQHVAPGWGRIPAPVVYTEQVETAAPGAVVLAIVDTTSQPNALGWHSESRGDVEFGEIAAKPVLDNGGDALTRTLSVASVLSHEVCEWFIDPHCNLTADTGNGTAISYEICDPVENDSYPVQVVPSGTTSAVNVTVSNFVLPAWFDPQPAASQKLDYLGSCTAAFQITKGGYAVVIKEGKVRQVFGEQFPEWRKSLKDSPRYRRLLGALTPAYPDSAPVPASRSARDVPTRS